MTLDTQARLSDAPLGVVSVDGGDLQVVFTRRYNKPAAKVWSAVTTPERLADWLAYATYEPRAGSDITLSWNKGAHVMTGKVTVYDPPRAFAFIWPLDGRDTQVRFDIEPDGEGAAILTLTHSGLATKGWSTGVRAGWHAHLEGLPEAMEGRATPWAVKTERENALSARYPKLG